MFDYAIALANLALKERFFDNNSYEGSVAMIKKASKDGCFPEFIGKAFIYKLFNYCSEKLRPISHEGWADSDRDIGNIRDL
jgi:hypothetical protein